MARNTIIIFTPTGQVGKFLHEHVTAAGDRLAVCMLSNVYSIVSMSLIEEV
jgi:hypothetical protein